jgi:hypothetical protein
VRRRTLGVLVVLAVLALLAPVPTRAADTCSLQARRVRLPDGFAEARVSFLGILNNGRNRVGETFPGHGLRELRVVVNWKEIDHVHQQRLELYSPDGSLYQQLTTAFTGVRPAPRQAAHHPGVTVTTRIPVAGTSIVDSSLFGEWCAEVFLDDEAAPIARHRFFLDAP